MISHSINQPCVSCLASHSVTNLHAHTLTQSTHTNARTVRRYIIPSTVVDMFLRSTQENGGKCNSGIRSPSNPHGYCGVSSLGIR